MSPQRVLAEHSSRELSEWLAYDRALGLGRADDHRAGTIAAALWNVQGGVGSKGQKRAATPGDFFPRLDADEEEAPPTHDADRDEDGADEPDMDEAERATRAMKNAFAMWGLQQNAALRAAQRLDAGEPPEDPTEN